MELTEVQDQRANSETENATSSPDPPSQQESSGVSRPSELPSVVRYLETRVRHFQPSFPCVLHWLLTLSATLLFFAALLTDQWRLFLVNRKLLLELYKASDLNDSLLRSIITMTRRQGIFTDCFDNVLTSSSKGTEVFKSGCQSIISGKRTANPVGEHDSILALLEMHMVLGPIVLVFSVIAILIHLACELMRPRPNVCLSVCNAIFRMINTILCVIFFVFADDVSKSFQTFDPGYPISWPVPVRLATKIDIWRFGPIAWMIGALLQAVAAGFDICRCVHGEEEDPSESSVEL